MSGQMLVTPVGTLTGASDFQAQDNQDKHCENRLNLGRALLLILVTLKRPFGDKHDKQATSPIIVRGTNFTAPHNWPPTTTRQSPSMPLSQIPLTQQLPSTTTRAQQLPRPNDPPNHPPKTTPLWRTSSTP
jgi:hypothetical protein